MTLINPPLLVHGGTHAARAFRMMVRDLSHGAQGITEGDDLKVTQLATPGTGVRVGDGSAVIRGAMAWGQGSYTQYNVGFHSVPIAPTGVSPRSDLLVLRVEDPEYEGVRNPERDDIGYFHVIPNVSANMVTPPAGMTAVALARIDLPANTRIVTDSMIKDVRTIANPRRERQLHTASPGEDQNWAGNKGSWVDWPPTANFEIRVPDWARRARIVMTVSGLQVLGSIWGSTAFRLGAVQGQAIQIDDGSSIRGGDASVRISAISADTIDIPAEMRGTSQRLQGMVFLTKDNLGSLQADIVTTIIADVEFEEGI
ncbi:hypothetical protein ACFW6V_25715 [Streptomyces sp. NPDC058734]|uniref:hypothetical protein n=1 Tax=Streptomyces sp. NPDC058734 TaxID=3346615 RepID=UPI0036C6DD7E